MIQVLEDGLNKWNARDIKLDVHVQAQGIFFLYKRHKSMNHHLH